MKKNNAMLVGLMTALPYAAVIIGLFYYFNGAANSIFFNTNNSQRMAPFDIFMFIGCAFILLFYTFHIQWNSMLNNKEKNRWKILIWFFSIVTVWIYWYKYILNSQIKEDVKSK